MQRQKEESLKKEEKNLFKPALNRNSLKMAEKNKQKGVLSRKQKDLKKGIQVKQERQWEEQKDCTFRPEINKKSRVMGESFLSEEDRFESLFLDHQRRQVSMATMHQREKENQGLTFKPELNQNSLN